MTQAQNYHEQLSADRDEFSQGSIPNPLFIFRLHFICVYVLLFVFTSDSIIINQFYRYLNTHHTTRLNKGVDVL